MVATTFLLCRLSKTTDSTDDKTISFLPSSTLTINLRIWRQSDVLASHNRRLKATYGYINKTFNYVKPNYNCVETTYNYVKLTYNFLRLFTQHLRYVAFPYTLRNQRGYAGATHGPHTSG